MLKQHIAHQISEFAENQYQPNYSHPISTWKVWCKCVIFSLNYQMLQQMPSHQILLVSSWRPLCVVFIAPNHISFTVFLSLLAYMSNPHTIFPENVLCWPSMACHLCNNSKNRFYNRKTGFMTVKPVFRFITQMTCHSRPGFQILWKFKTIQATATLYPDKKFGHDIWLIFPLNYLMSSRILSS